MARVILAHAIEVMERPWKWGEADCCTAACDVFMRLTGIDPMASLRGVYTTRAGAVAMIRSLGGFEQMADTLAARAGLTATNGAPGDIAVGRLLDGRHVLTIGVAPGVFVGKSPSGMATVPHVTRCYRA
jgi:hypothetical protein